MQAETLERAAAEALSQAEAVKASSREVAEALRSQLAAAARELDVLRASSDAATDKALAALKVSWIDVNRIELRDQSPITEFPRLAMPAQFCLLELSWACIPFWCAV